MPIKFLTIINGSMLMKVQCVLDKVASLTKLHVIQLIRILFCDMICLTKTLHRSGL